MPTPYRVLQHAYAVQLKKAEALQIKAAGEADRTQIAKLQHNAGIAAAAYREELKLQRSYEAVVQSASKMVSLVRHAFLLNRALHSY